MVFWKDNCIEFENNNDGVYYGERYVSFEKEKIYCEERHSNALTNKEDMDAYYCWFGFEWWKIKGKHRYYAENYKV